MADRIFRHPFRAAYSLHLFESAEFRWAEIRRDGEAVAQASLGRDLSLSFLLLGCGELLPADVNRWIREALANVWGTSPIIPEVS